MELEKVSHFADIFCFSRAWPVRKGAINRSPMFFDPSKLNLLHQHRAPPKKPTYEVIHLLHALNSSDILSKFFCYPVIWVGDSFSKLRNIASSRKNPEKTWPKASWF